MRHSDDKSSRSRVGNEIGCTNRIQFESLLTEFKSLLSHSSVLNESHFDRVSIARGSKCVRLWALNC